MIEVILYRSDQRVSRVFDIEDPETAVFAARTLWDDELRESGSVQGTTRSMRTVFLVDGKMCRMVEGHRP